MSFCVRLLLVPIAFIIFATACGQTPNPPVAANTPQSSPSAPVPKKITAADLSKLRWIEGSWKGTGRGVEPFFERYKFENDSTLAVETPTDDTFTKVSDVSRFELKDGNFGYNSGESGSVAIALDENLITFAPLGKARNSFTWQRESNDSWKAILNWTDKDGKPKERIYNMTRLPEKK